MAIAQELAGASHEERAARFKQWRRRLDRFPRTAAGSSLRHVGVTIIDHAAFVLACDWCGAEWSPGGPGEGKLKRNYWRCPNGCNAPDKRPSRRRQP